MNSPFDTKEAKEYYKKCEFAVPANLDVEKLDPQAQFEVEEVDLVNQHQMIEQLNASAAKFTNHSFVSFIASVDIGEVYPVSPNKIHSMICSQKQPVHINSYDNFKLERMPDNAINVKLKFKVEELHASILLYICKNFTYLLHEPEIRHLTKDDFRLIMKHKYLNVTQEDEVLKAICLWLEG